MNTQIGDNKNTPIINPLNTYLLQSGSHPVGSKIESSIDNRRYELVKIIANGIFNDRNILSAITTPNEIEEIVDKVIDISDKLLKKLDKKEGSSINKEDEILFPINTTLVLPNESENILNHTICEGESFHIKTHISNKNSQNNILETTATITINKTDKISYLETYADKYIQWIKKVINLSEIIRKF